MPLQRMTGMVTLPKRMVWEHRKERSVCSTSSLSDKQTLFVKPQRLQDIPGPKKATLYVTLMGRASQMAPSQTRPHAEAAQ